MREVYLYNPYHLGDSYFVLHFLRKVCQSNNDIRFILQTAKGYWEECGSFIGEFRDRILLQELKRKNEGINGWYGSIRLKTGFRDGAYVINERYDEFFDYLSGQIGVDNPVKGKNCTLIDHPAIKEDKRNLDCDILLVNSLPLSRQYLYFEDQFERKVNELKERYKIVCTRSIKNVDIPCTVDYRMNLLEIGNLSTKAKYVIGIATAPIIPCFNIYNIDTVKKWFVLSKRSTYSYNDRIFRKTSVKHISLGELK